MGALFSIALRLWSIGSRAFWTRRHLRESFRTSLQRHSTVSFSTSDSMRAAKLVTSATPAQLTSLLDLDLWRHEQAGRDERFDVDRFGEWLDVLAEAGDSVAARTVAALDKDLVVAGLSRYVRVLDPGIFEPIAQSDDERIERREAMLEGDSLDADSNGDGLDIEIGGYIVRARRTDAWDAIVTLLVTLENEHADHFRALMEGVRLQSNSRSEIDGLDDLLTEPEQHLHDVSVERAQRRSRRGYATPADARAFLQMARQPKPASTGPVAANPIVAAYFWATEEEEEEERREPSDNATAAGGDDGIQTAGDIPASVEEVIELLTEAGVMPTAPRALLGATNENGDAAGTEPVKLLVLRRLMEFVLHRDEAAYFTRSRELAFLANTLVAGSSVQSRPFTPQEASDAAACICNLGLDCTPAPPDDFLVEHNLVAAFEVGWSVLYQDVSLLVTDQLIATLANLVCADADTRRGLRTLKRTLVQQREAGTPWLARDAIEVLAMLDTTAWISVAGLLDECPIAPAALTAVLEGRTTSVSPTAFEFISTTAQIGDIRVFTRMLPDLLSR